MRKILAPIALTAALAGGAGALILGPTFAGAQTTGDSTTVPAPAAGSAADEVRKAPFTDVISGLVADGTLTQAQADKVIAALEAARPLKGPGHRMGVRIRAGLDAAAEYLGVTEGELHDALRGGKTLAAIASEKGKSVDGLVDVLVAEATERIDAAVTAGKLTAAQAAELKANVEERTTSMVNEGPKLRRRGPGGHGPFGRGASDEVDIEAEATSA